MNAAKPIFVSGLYRSGTTVLTRVLDQSEELKITYDTIHYMRFSYKNYLPIGEKYIDLVKDTEKRIRNKFELDIHADKTIKELSKIKNITEANVYDALVKNFLDIGNLNCNWGEKTNVAWEQMLEFLDMFPEGRCVHIYRDPRAVLASYKGMTCHEGHKYLDAIFAALAMFKFISKKEISENENIYLIKYEDFVNSPKSVVIDLCKFLKIDFTENMLDITQFKNRHNKPFDTDSSFTAQKKEIDTSSLELWKDKLSNIEIYLLEHILKEEMLNFKYLKQDITLSEDEQKQLDEVLLDPFIKKRYDYYLNNNDAIQGYPNDNNY